MPTRMFVNLPVADLGKSKAFFQHLGFAFNPQFTDDKAACMIVGDESFVMLLSEPFFRSFTEKTIVDARSGTEVMIALSAESKDAVDLLVGKALSLGATVARPPEDLDFMYGRSFNDPDGHIWEIIWMDLAAAPQKLPG